MVADLYPKTVLVIATILVGSTYPGRATPQSVDTCNLRSATITQRIGVIQRRLERR